MPYHLSLYLTLRRSRLFNLSQHPCQSICILLSGENFSSVFFDASIATPDFASFTGVFKVGEEVGRTFFAKRLFKNVEMLKKWTWHRNLNLDWPLDIRDRPSDAAREASAALQWR